MHRNQVVVFVKRTDLYLMPVPHEKIMQKNPLEICTTSAATNSGWISPAKKKFQIDSQRNPENKISGKVHTSAAHEKSVQ